MCSDTASPRGDMEVVSEKTVVAICMADARRAVRDTASMTLWGPRPRFSLRNTDSAVLRHRNLVSVFLVPTVPDKPGGIIMPRNSISQKLFHDTCKGRGAVDACVKVLEMVVGLVQHERPKRETHQILNLGHTPVDA